MHAVVRGVNWLVDPPRRAGIGCAVKIRARSPALPARIEPDHADPQLALVRFAEPAFAVTPGQAAVFYQGSRVLGGCWIEHAL